MGGGFGGVEVTLLSNFHVYTSPTVLSSVRPSEIEYLEIRVHNPYHEDLIELNPRMSAFFKLEDV